MSQQAGYIQNMKTRHNAERRAFRGRSYKKGGKRIVDIKLVPCPGEAHSNPWIDHCMLCAPRWGWIEES